MAKIHLKHIKGHTVYDSQQKMRVKCTPSSLCVKSETERERDRDREREKSISFFCCCFVVTHEEREVEVGGWRGGRGGSGYVFCLFLLLFLTRT